MAPKNQLPIECAMKSKAHLSSLSLRVQVLEQYCTHSREPLNTFLIISIMRMNIWHFCPYPAYQKWQFHIVQIKNSTNNVNTWGPEESPGMPGVDGGADPEAFLSLAWPHLEMAVEFGDRPHWPLSRAVSMGVPQDKWLLQSISGAGMCSDSWPRSGAASVPCQRQELKGPDQPSDKCSGSLEDSREEGLYAHCLWLPRTAGQSYTTKLLWSQAKPCRFSAGRFSPEVHLCEV